VIYVLEHFISVGSFLLAVVLLTDVFRHNRPPSVTMAWAMAIVLMPYVGVPFYILFGGRKLQRVRERKADLFDAGAGELATPMPPRCLADRVLRSGGMPPPRAGHTVDLHFSGETAFHALIALLERAEHSIHITTFILGRDEAGRAIVEVLTRKASEGVEVRLLLDSLGSMWTQHGFVRSLREAGGSVGHFLPVLPVRRRWSANLRNHRKLVVVDNASAMVGGMNLSTLFMGPTPNPARFLDASVFLSGPAVCDIQDIFLNDWQYATGVEQEVLADTLPPCPATGERIVQVAASGPDCPDDTMHDALASAIGDASERIWIVTPYFVPDEFLVKALKLQARMGRDVRIIVPRRSNHRIADWARRPALRRLHEAGVQVYAYPQGMIHTKLLLFDDALAVSGSPNLDMRSMYLNFEIALFHYSAEDIRDIESWFNVMFSRCVPWVPKPLTLTREWAEGICKLVSPLL
jgi:cardiolipin synthase